MLRTGRKFLNDMQYGGVSIMVWGAFPYRGGGGGDYRAASCARSSNRSQIHPNNFFQANNTRFLDHPPCSPDLNPIENLRVYKMDVYKNRKHLETVGVRRQALFTSWRNIPDNLMQTLVSSMPQEIFKVINKNGGMHCFHYLTRFLLFLVLWSINFG